MGPLVDVGIDLHNELRHLDKLPWEQLFARSDLIETDGTKVRVLCPEDHLRVMCVDWLTDGGEYKERLWDIYHVSIQREDIRLGQVSSTRRPDAEKMDHFRYRSRTPLFGPGNFSDLPFAKEAEMLPAWLIVAVEKAWASDIRLRPLNLCLRDRRVLIRADTQAAAAESGPGDHRARR